MLYPSLRRLSPSEVVVVSRYNDPEILIAASLRSISVVSGRPSRNHFVSAGGAVSWSRLGWSCDLSIKAEGPFAPAKGGADVTRRFGASPIAPTPSRIA